MKLMDYRLAKQAPDEMFVATDQVHDHCQPLYEWLQAQPADRLIQKRAEADLAFRRVGITFAV